MPRFEPFHGLRYNSRIPLDEVIAPPYDVVGPEERAKLAERHTANAIHVELPEADPGTGLDRYQAAGKLFAQWVEDGVIKPDARPSVYPYRMTEPDGTSTTGVIGALGCEPHGGDVLPHEQTMPKDMSDRLDLLRSCQANLSPIWGLSLSEGLADSYAPSGSPRGSATDDAGVRHELWVVDDHAKVEAIRRGVAGSPVVIADGHHRYETALAYRAERRAASGDAAGGYDFVMALIVELSEDQLSVSAIHRVVKGLDPASVEQTFADWFDYEDIGVPDQDLVHSLIERRELGLVTAGRAWKITPKAQAVERAGSDLDSSLIAEALEGAGVRSVAYRHDPAEALSEVVSGAADAALILRPVTVEQISSWAHAGRRMPPKSTYFHPKPRTGMVFRSLVS